MGMIHATTGEHKQAVQSLIAIRLMSRLRCILERLNWINTLRLPIFKREYRTSYYKSMIRLWVTSMMLYWYKYYKSVLIEVFTRESLYRLRTSWTQIQVIFIRGLIQPRIELYLSWQYGTRNAGSYFCPEGKTNR